MSTLTETVSLFVGGNWELLSNLFPFLIFPMLNTVAEKGNCSS